MRNQKKAMLAVLLAICSAVNTGMISVSGTAADENHALPEWVPQNFVDALKFDNQYGKTHIEDGVICCVRKQSKDERYSYQTEYSEISEDQILLSETYDLVMPEKPDESDFEAYEAYQKLLDEIGLPSFYVDMNIQIDFCYEVSVYLPDTSQELAVNWLTMVSGRDEPSEVINLTFETTAEGSITETDLYGWLPDSITEYNDFYTENQGISVHNGYIVYCDNVAIDGGYSVIPEQKGTAKVELVTKDLVKKAEIIETVGSSGHTLMVYKPVTPGTIKMTFTQMQEWNPDGLGTTETTQCYAIAEDGTITEIEEGDVIEVTLGDCNLDGTFSVADVIMLQKWLLAVPDVHLDNWEAADFTKDGRLNAFDLVLMKRELLKNKKEEVYPVENPEVIDEFTPCTATLEDEFVGWEIRIVIKHQYSVPERVWTIEDFAGADNIYFIHQSAVESPYRQILTITLENQSREDVLKLIHDIENLGIVEIKEVNTVHYATGVN